ncbi:MAG: hypothetical protein DDT21_00357 [Syntrophomonadaceae bacterium]|nr:hypothetical protein [Bacillota bacterium]
MLQYRQPAALWQETLVCGQTLFYGSKKGLRVGANAVSQGGTATLYEIVDTHAACGTIGKM